GRPQIQPIPATHRPHNNPDPGQEHRYTHKTPAHPPGPTKPLPPHTHIMTGPRRKPKAGVRLHSTNRDLPPPPPEPRRPSPPRGPTGWGYVSFAARRRSPTSTPAVRTAEGQTDRRRGRAAAG